MKKHTFKGTEFIEGEAAMIGSAEVVVIRWTKQYGGWWYCQIVSNGGMCYTQELTKKI